MFFTKYILANAGDVGLTLGFGSFPGEGNSVHSSMLIGEIPSTEEPGRLQSTRVTKESDTI